MNKMVLDLYSDYLLASSGGPVTATGLSTLLDEKVSHDSVTRFLRGNGDAPTAREWWRTVKPIVRRIESDEGVLIADDTIGEKPYSEENPIVCWHFDHSKGRNVKGINLLTLLYTAQVGPEKDETVSIPLSFELIEKTPLGDVDGCARARAAPPRQRKEQE